MKSLLARVGFLAMGIGCACVAEHGSRAKEEPPVSASGVDRAPTAEPWRLMLSYSDATLEYLGTRDLVLFGLEGRFLRRVDSFSLHNAGSVPIYYWASAGQSCIPLRLVFLSSEGEGEEQNWVDVCPYGVGPWVVNPGDTIELSVDAWRQESVSLGILIGVGSPDSPAMLWSARYQSGSRTLAPSKCDSGAK